MCILCHSVKPSSHYDTGSCVASCQCHVALLCNIVNGSTCTLREATRFDARMDCGSILAYVTCQMLVGEDNRQWVETIGVANAQHVEL